MLLRKQKCPKNKRTIKKLMRIKPTFFKKEKLKKGGKKFKMCFRFTLLNWNKTI